MELLLEEIRSLKPYVEETNKTLSVLQEKWSFMDKRVFELEQGVISVEQVSTTVQSLQVEITSLKRQTEELENRNRRNNLRIYGLAENEEGGNPIEFFKNFLPKILGLPLSSPLNIQRAHRLGPKTSDKT